jgi:hypothetical protein
MSLIFRHVLHRVRVTNTQDRYGNEVPGSWSEPTPLIGWAVDAGDTSEDRNRGEGSTVEYTVRHIGQVDVLASDRIVYMGKTYEVEGEVRYQPGPTDRTSHTIIRLRRAVG